MLIILGVYSMNNSTKQKKKQPEPRYAYPQDKDLHNVSLEKDSCGTGFIVHLKKQASHTLVHDALTMLKRMDHRGARGAEVNSGDGVGIMISIPHELLQEKTKALGMSLPTESGGYATGNIFLPQNKEHRQECKKHFSMLANTYGVAIIGWRTLEVDNSSLGKSAKACEPVVEQVYLVAKKEISSQLQKLNFQQKVYLLQKKASNSIRGSHYDPHKSFYICSLSSETIVYKGMLTTEQLQEYYLDLQHEHCKAYLALVHSRFSTNTFPSWDRAQPFRMMSHNGEINTLLGNQNKMNARQQIMESASYGELLSDIYPIIAQDTSDSGAFDSTMEFLYNNGFSLDKIACMMIPEAWQHDDLMTEERKAMYQAYSCVMEPWDGPACITFTDGRYVGAVIDRNGLRPSRYYVTNQDTVIMASEFGVVEIDQNTVIKKDRLQPGKVFLIDTHTHTIVSDEDIKKHLETQQPYSSWLQNQQIRMQDLEEQSIETISEAEIERRTLSYGYTKEDALFLLKPMVELAKEPIGSMGNDVALACLSEQPRLLYDYFKQWFAQVTNPPIDSIRERVIMSIGSYIGKESNILSMDEHQCNRIWIEHPVLTHKEFFKLQHLDYKGWKSRTIDISYPIADGEEGLQKAVEAVKKKAEEVAADDVQVIILSDRRISKDRVAMSALMAVSAVHHHLIEKKLRSNVAIVIDSGEPREVHHFCTLIGYGADAIFPYLAFELLYKMHGEHVIDTSIAKEDIDSRFLKAIEYGVCKVIAKMGISTIDSYRGSQIFEAVGLGKDVIDSCFQGTVSRLEGISFKEIAKEYMQLHQKGYSGTIDTTVVGANIINLGNFQWREEGLQHMWDPESVALFQHALRANDKTLFDTFAERQNTRSASQATIRGLFRFSKQEPVPIEKVEPVSEIVKRFATGAMSYGSISQKAHEAIAIGMNRIGAKSNTGEGGELSERFVPMANGDSKRSAIKQVASGRFGVTIEYLANSDEIQIKMAQGAKPGEGGELPGKKVLTKIAQTRHSIPGIGLISPPPHHDIYSIEDLAQLIYDLKNANPNARISVKLVSKAGVGVIAAGVAKGKADHILISGHDGGTGASPLTSIKHAGLPWELGIAETHQVLVRNGLRSRVILQTDGQLKTGRDLAIAAILGAEEFGFATSALIALGCIMMRKCELNTCPVGVATHDEKLVDKFTGKPEYIERMMHFIAENLREVMASIGITKVENLIGRTDLLEVDETVLNWKSRTLNLNPLLGKEIGDEASLQQYCSISQDHGLDSVLDRQILADFQESIDTKAVQKKEYRIKNTDRAVGTIVSNAIAKKYGLKGLREDSIQVHVDGHAGQSFGAFLAHGVTLRLSGDANDYVGKGLSGGILEIVPQEKRAFVPEDNIIVGNVVLYGAVLGKAFINGKAAERFCIRNSGAHAVVEGAGAHACEYMTGGRVLILGEVGRNFCSGMSGGLVYVWDIEKTVSPNLHNPLAKIYKTNAYDVEEIQSMLQEHYKRTASSRAEYLLHNWDLEIRNFVKVGTEEFVSIIDNQRDMLLESKKGAI